MTSGFGNCPCKIHFDTVLDVTPLMAASLFLLIFVCFISRTSLSGNAARGTTGVNSGFSDFPKRIIDGTIHEIGDEKDVFEGRGIGSVQPSCNAAFQTADFAGKRGGRHVVEDNKLSDGIRKMGGGGFHNSFSVA